MAATMMSIIVRMQKQSAPILLVMGALMLVGCQALAIGGAAVAYNELKEKPANFMQQHYAVADYMIAQADTYIDRRRDLIIAKPLSDSKQPGMTSLLGHMIPEEIGLRFAQLGYRVDLSDVTPEADINYLRPAIKVGEVSDFLLSGNMTQFDREIAVDMRITEISSGRVISAYSYTMPLTSEVRKLAQPKPLILRMTGQRTTTTVTTIEGEPNFSTPQGREAWEGYKAAKTK